MMMSMATRRARKHKDLVEREKFYHHQSGMILYKGRKIRYVNIRRAEAIESAYEWHKREKRNPELAQELNELFDWMK